MTLEKRDKHCLLQKRHASFDLHRCRDLLLEVPLRHEGAVMPQDATAFACSSRVSGRAVQCLGPLGATGVLGWSCAMCAMPSAPVADHVERSSVVACQRERTHALVHLHQPQRHIRPLELGAYGLCQLHLRRRGGNDRLSPGLFKPLGVLRQIIRSRRVMQNLSMRSWHLRPHAWDP